MNIGLGLMLGGVCMRGGGPTGDGVAWDDGEWLLWDDGSYVEWDI